MTHLTPISHNNVTLEKLMNYAVVLQRIKNSHDSSNATA